MSAIAFRGLLAAVTSRRSSMRPRVGVLAAVCLLGLAGVLPGRSLASGTTTILPYQAAGYRYLQVPSGQEPVGWQNPGFDDSGWAAGDAAFGSGGACPLQPTVKTQWGTNTDMLLRQPIAIPAGTNGVIVSVAVDNDVQVYWNGTLVGSATHEGCPAHNDFSFRVPDNLLGVGNLLAVRGIDRSCCESFLDVTVTPAPPAPPPSLTIALSKPAVSYGTQVMLSGNAANVQPGTTVTLFAQQYGQPSPVQLAVVQSGTDGSFGYLTTPHLYTTYTASMQSSTGTVESSPVVAQVAPKVQLLPGKNGLMRVQVTAGKSLWHHRVLLQRRSRFGQWVNIAALQLDHASSAMFRIAQQLPRGASRIRVSLSVSEAGTGLLGAHSGTQLVQRR